MVKGVLVSSTLVINLDVQHSSIQYLLTVTYHVLLNLDIMDVCIK